jgi:hypothetical protein
MALNSMSLLSGRYLQAEQVSPGLVQTFRARDFATDKPVFVHRIGDSDCAEQASLLKLLLSCLYRSPAVKQMVLEVREDAEACYVVTEAAPQCFLLREWLEFEAKTLEEAISAPQGAPNAPPVSNPGEQAGDVVRLACDPPAPFPGEEGDGGGPASRASDEISLPTPFVSDQQPAVPQAAPIKIIRPLPPEFNPGAFEGAGPVSKQHSEEIDVLSAPHPRDQVPEDQLRVDRPIREAAPKPSEFLPQAVQRPVGVLSLDEFDRLFEDPVGVPDRKAMRADMPAPVQRPIPPSAPPVAAPSPILPYARPVTGPVTSVSQRPTTPGSGAFTQPILPSAAQTVLESALAAQAASQRNRKLIIGAIAVVLIVLAIVLYLLMGARMQ